MKTSVCPAQMTIYQNSKKQKHVSIYIYELDDNNNNIREAQSCNVYYITTHILFLLKPVTAPRACTYLLSGSFESGTTVPLMVISKANL